MGEDSRKVRADKDTYNYLVADTGPSFYRGFRERNKLAESHTVSGRVGTGPGLRPLEQRAYLPLLQPHFSHLGTHQHHWPQGPTFKGKLLAEQRGA